MGGSATNDKVSPAGITELKPRIMVIGVGGAGGNAVSNMIEAKLEGVEFMVANTDAQALAQSPAGTAVQMGTSITEGLGAGARPEVGCAAAEESLTEIREQFLGSHMLFITAGMGGGTGTGAAPVIARAAREEGILTVGVVTKPFHFEGSRRMRTAEEGIVELQKYVDTLIIIPNQNLFRIANERTTFADAFSMADQVLHSGVRGITDLMVMPGLINLDFADVRTVMNEMGKAMMGTGEAEGDTRALEAAEAAINNPLLDEVSMKGARGVLINITGGMDMTLYEVDEAANRVRAEVDPDANIIVGSTFNEGMSGKVRVSVVATGIDGVVPSEVPQLPSARAGQAKGQGLAQPAAHTLSAMNVHELQKHAVSGWRPQAEAVLPEAVPAAAVDVTAETASVETVLEGEEAAPRKEMPLIGGDMILSDDDKVGGPKAGSTNSGKEGFSFEDTPAPAGARKAEQPAEEPKKRGLFGRMTQKPTKERAAAPERPQERPLARPEPIRPQTAEPEPLRPQSTRPKPLPKAAVQPRETEPFEEDQLEIPAFLRRQTGS